MKISRIFRKSPTGESRFEIEIFGSKFVKWPWNYVMNFIAVVIGVTTEVAFFVFCLLLFLPDFLLKKTGRKGFVQMESRERVEKGGKKMSSTKTLTMSSDAFGRV